MQTSPISKKTIIECQHIIPGELSFDYQGSALDFKLFAGEIISIIGPNYSGKAHWLKTICGLEDQHSGNVIINGIDTLQLSAPDWVSIRTKIAYLHADTALLSAANGLANAIMPARYHQVDKELDKELLIEKALDLLEEIDPEINLGDLPAYISKEHRYKIAVARALLLQPDVLALNNPYAHFNKDSKKQFERFLENQVKKGLTLIMVIHDVSYAVNNSDRIIFTDRENIYQFNSKQELIDCNIPVVKNFIQQNM